MPSYYWAGPGYGTYNEDGTMTGFISPDRYMDITVFGNGPGELQAALNIYNEMVSATQAALNTQQTAQHISDILNDGDPTNDYQAADLLDGHSDISITTPDGAVFSGSNAASYLRGDKILDVGVLAQIYIYANGSAADIFQAFNPFAIYHDGYGNDTSVIWNPAQNQYQSFDPSNDNDRALAASEYSQLAQQLRASGQTQQADYCDMMARFFRSTATERATLSPREWLRKDVGNSLSAPTATELSLEEKLTQLTMYDLYREGYDLENMTATQVDELVFARYNTKFGDVLPRSVRDNIALRPESLTNAQVAVGGAALLQAGINWASAGAYGIWATDMRSQIDALTSKLIAEQFYRVPLRPNDVETYFHDHYQGFLSTEEYNRQLLHDRLESEAFWGHP